MLLALLLQLDVAREIRRLGAEGVADRDAAAARLVKAGESAVAALQKALDDPDPEIGARAAAILRAIRPSRLESLFAEVRATVKSTDRLDALLAEAEALSAACGKAASMDPGARALRTTQRLKDSVGEAKNGALSGQRLVCSGVDLTSASSAVIVADGNVTAESLDNAVVVATGSISVRSATNCVLIAGGGVASVQMIQSCTIVTPDAVTGMYVLESVVHAGKGASPQLLYEGVLLNCDGSSSRQYGMQAPKRTDATGVTEWIEPRIRE